MIPDPMTLARQLAQPGVKQLAIGYTLNLCVEGLGWADGQVLVMPDSGAVRVSLRHKGQWSHSRWHTTAAEAMADAVRQLELNALSRVGTAQP